ncbi:hypothetical protein LTR62_005986 [Meristemomyces frigidus]|uniref:DUF4385 domain-containing protein n=1 Tax=Meristemomyces frigidus TaxID=1508187 RepID=A0AAN7YS45_9PEZI|nr:hypothetical protein LTR62_005986 [Meristemomyces frigidus]
MPPKKKPKDEKTPSLNAALLPTPALDSKDLRMSYHIARGEQGVLTFEPYKSLLLPYWRFKTIPIATRSSETLHNAFTHYVKAGDFVGADMSRKFIQMGMTRAKRYANHKGGRKYERSEREMARDGDEGMGRVELPKSEGHEGRDEKLRASEVFKETWRRCTSDEKYLEMKGEFLAEQKAWDREGRKLKEEGGGLGLKGEEIEVKREGRDDEG